MGELSKLKGLGQKSEKSLSEIGINSKADLEKIGPVRAFIKLKKECSIKPSLNFLYAMVGALENEHWANIAKSEKGRLLMEFEGYRELEEMLKAEGIEIEIWQSKFTRMPKSVATLCFLSPVICGDILDAQQPKAKVFYQETGENMIIEITTYKAADGITHEALMAASKAFDRDYCSHCKGLIRRQFLKTDEGYMDIFLWESLADIEHVQATFMQDKDAVAFAQFLNPDTLTMQNHEVLDVYEPGQA